MTGRKANIPIMTVHDKFFLAAQLPNTRHGEQLFVQFLSTSAGRMWLWKYGRFEMGFLGSDTFFSVRNCHGSRSNGSADELIDRPFRKSARHLGRLRTTNCRS